MESLWVVKCSSGRGDGSDFYAFPRQETGQGLPTFRKPSIAAVDPERLTPDMLSRSQSPAGTSIGRCSSRMKSPANAPWVAEHVSPQR